MAAELDVAARERLIEALAAGATKVQAAKVSGYSRKHIYRLLDDPAFVAAVDRRRAATTGASDRDEELALDVLRDVATNGEEEHNRVAAAKALLAHGIAKRAKAPKAVAPSAPPPLKIVDGAEAAKAWLEKQA
jgi:hypothetical protein